MHGTARMHSTRAPATRIEFYGENFQIRILNRGQIEKLTSLTKRI